MRSHSKALVAVAALFIGVLSLASIASAAQVRPDLAFDPGGSNPGSISVDPSNGDVYVLDTGFPATIQRFDSSGVAKPFSALAGSNVLNGSDIGSDNDQTPANGFSFDGGSQVAIDRSGGATDGTIYVADSSNNVVDAFANSGQYLGQLNGSGTPQGKWSEAFAYPCGVAVDPSGNVYVSTASSGQISRFTPAASPVEDSDYDAQIGEVFTCALAADSTGAVYAAPTAFGGSGAAIKYAASDFGSLAPAGTQVADTATALAVDPSNDDLYVNSGTQISRLDSTGASLEDPFGSTSLTNSHGVGVYPSTGAVYASQREEVTSPIEPPTMEGRIHIFSTAIEVAVDLTTDITNDSATLNGHLDPGGVDTDYYFEYTTDGTTWISVPGHFGGFKRPWVPDPASAGSGPTAVAQSTESALDESVFNGGKPVPLQPNTTYRVRLHTTGPIGDAISPEDTFTTEGLGPDAQTRDAGIGITTATLAGRVNPHNSSTTYWFEYGSDDCSVTPCTSVPLSEDADAGSGNDWKEVSQQLSGLTPGATYHFRILAENSAGSATGEDQTFATASALPPTPAVRGYEKVSPDAKNGVSVSGGRAVNAGANGERVILTLAGNAVDAQSGLGGSTLLAFRDLERGWIASSINPPLPVERSLGFQGFSADLSGAVLRSNAALAPGAIEGELPNLYLRHAISGDYELLTPIQNGSLPDFIGASGDFSHIVYRARAPQTTDPVSEAQHPYMWVDGKVQLLGVLPDGTSSAGAEIIGSGTGGVSDQAISRDGSRVVFHTSAPGESAVDHAAGPLYVREIGNPDAEPPVLARTVQVNESERVPPDPAGPLPAVYWASEPEHGSKVLFTSCEKLTNDSTASVASPECTSGRPASSVNQSPGRDLYLFDVESGELEDLTTDDPSGADVWGVLGASGNLDRVYFVAGGELAAGAIRGAANLYLWHNGEVRLIATLQSDRDADFSVLKLIRVTDGNNYSLSDESGFVGSGRSPATRVTPDGRVAVFVSRAPLTGYDNRNPQACPSWQAQGGTVRNPEGRCLEVYRYDAEESQLSCVSCDPTGAPPAGDAMLTLMEKPAGRQIANLSDDGNRVFFQSPDPLAPDAGDSNGKVDVYVWDRGAVRLLSSGLDTSDSQFVGATPDGSNAFIRTRAQLVRRDRDSLADIYDVRVGGGFNPPLPPPGCEGETCQSPPSAPNDPSPSSSSFQGPGSPRSASQRRCAKGKVRRNGKCANRKHRGKKTRANNNRRAHR